jgi:hypothetical protein
MKTTKEANIFRNSRLFFVYLVMRIFSVWNKRIQPVRAGPVFLGAVTG